MDYVQARLFALQDLDYRAFQCGLIPNIDPATVIGVRTPALRKFAKQFFKMPESAQWMQQLPHRYYEENNLHGFLIEQMRDFDQVLAALNAFLPFVDNWATCDLMYPKALEINLPALRVQIGRWLESKHTYTVRFAIGLLMRAYRDEDALKSVAKIRSEEYYVNMMIAWFFATALARQYDAALPYLDQLAPWVHNKAIQKAVESKRIPQARKDALRALKWKR